MDLAHFADDEGNIVRIAIVGCDPRRDGVEAEVIIETSFINARLACHISPHDLSTWQSGLDKIEAGNDRSWMMANKGVEVRIKLEGVRGCPDVIITEEQGSMVTVQVPVDLPEDWIKTHRNMLAAVRAAWNLSATT